MTRKKNIWKNKQGNVCFNFEYDSKWWVIPSIVIAMLVITCILEYILNGTCYGVIPSILFILFVADNCASYSENKADKALLSQIRSEITKLVRKELAKRIDVKEKNRRLYTKYRGTYGGVESQSVLILLSDNTILEFPLIWHGGDEPYYELQGNVRVSEDKEHRNKICGSRIRNRITNIHVSNENKLRFLLFGILLISLAVVASIVWLVCKYEQEVFKWLIGYIITFVVLGFIPNKLECKILHIIYNILFIPFNIIKLAQPVMTILVAFLGIPMIVFGIPFCFLRIISIWGTEFSLPSMFLISLTISAIACVHSRSFTCWLIKHSPIKDYGNHRYEKFSELLAIYITEPQNYNLVFSILYVVFLSCSAFYNIEYKTDFISEDADIVVLKSFLIFMAFNTMMQRSRETDINTEDLLAKVIGLFVHDDPINTSEQERH